MDGHLEEACFKKHGYPEWFKEYKDSKAKKGQGFAGNVAAQSSSELPVLVDNSSVDINKLSDYSADATLCERKKCD